MLEDSHPPPPYPHNSSFKLFIACGAMGFASGLHLGSLHWAAEGWTWVACGDKSSAKSRAGSGGTGAAVLCSPFQIMTPDPFAMLEYCEIILRGMPNADLDRIRLLFAYLKLLCNESQAPPQW